MKRSFWAARPFGYGDKYPMLDVGQVIEIDIAVRRSSKPSNGSYFSLLSGLFS